LARHLAQLVEREFVVGPAGDRQLESSRGAPGGFYAMHELRSAVGPSPTGADQRLSSSGEKLSAIHASLRLGCANVRTSSGAVKQTRLREISLLVIAESGQTPQI